MKPHPLAARHSPLHHGRGFPLDGRLPLLYRLVADVVGESAPPGPLTRDARLVELEAALFAADEPLPPRKLASVAGLADAAEARRLVERLRHLYDADGTAFQVEELAGGYLLLTRGAVHPWLARLSRSGADARLSAAARETLTVVAYRQPITRADVEAVRGVSCSDVLHQLMDKGLVRISGRDDSLGRPALYGTTRKFLQLYGLKALSDLPAVEDLTAPKDAAT